MECSPLNQTYMSHLTLNDQKSQKEKEDCKSQEKSITLRNRFPGTVGHSTYELTEIVIPYTFHPDNNLKIKG